MRGAVAGDLEMTLVGAFGRLFAGRYFADTATDHDIDGTAARAHQKRAAGRNRQRPAVGRAGVLVGSRQNDRRLAGVNRRRHPGIDPDIGRRQHAVPVERRGNAHRSFVPGGEISRRRHHHDQRAQRPGVVARQPRRRQAGADALDRGQRALALHLPQSDRDRILARQRVGERGRRAMSDAGAAVEPAQAFFAARPAVAQQREQRAKRQGHE